LYSIVQYSTLIETWQDGVSRWLIIRFNSMYYSPRLRRHGDSQTIVFLPAKTPPRHFQVVLWSKPIHPNHAQINQYGPINHWIVNSISELYLVKAGYIALTSFAIIWSASTR
jgi:hypothetical protein